MRPRETFPRTVSGAWARPVAGANGASYSHTIMNQPEESRVPRGELDSDDITRLLGAAQRGSSQAMDEVFESVYPKLREMAQSRRRGWRGNYTMNTTALIHEAYVKVARQAEGADYQNRGHFFAVAARAMRQVLINYAEKQNAKKRGGGAAEVTLYEKDAVHEEALDEILALEAALKKLEALSERQAQVVECLFFAGLGVQETAEALAISPATVKRDWSAARAWLYREIQGGA
ncbi:MAG: ECF-type sigma factor [Gemmatimonadota bacterium]|nr:ECF-type sigma factor [Gemmatimonadota bacterium]